MTNSASTERPSGSGADRPSTLDNTTEALRDPFQDSPIPAELLCCVNSDRAITNSLGEVIDMCQERHALPKLNKDSSKAPSIAIYIKEYSATISATLKDKGSLTPLKQAFVNVLNSPIFIHAYDLHMKYNILVHF